MTLPGLCVFKVVTNRCDVRIGLKRLYVSEITRPSLLSPERGALVLMKILVAEDEPEIALQYEAILSERNHEVQVTHNGEDCIKAYYEEMDKVQAKNEYSPLKPPFDAVILDYRMPKRDGMQVAREILTIQPKQRILFASAYVLETLADSIKTLEQVVELIQKPFDLDSFADLIEDKGIWKDLEGLNANISAIKGMNPTHREIRDLLEGLRKIQKGRMLRPI